MPYSDSLSYLVHLFAITRFFIKVLFSVSSNSPRHYVPSGPLGNLSIFLYYHVALISESRIEVPSKEAIFTKKEVHCKNSEARKLLMTWAHFFPNACFISILVCNFMLLLKFLKICREIWGGLGLFGLLILFITWIIKDRQKIHIHT